MTDTTTAGLGSDPARKHVNPGEIAIGVIIGRTAEFFDFFVYAIASVIVFPRLVFPFASELTGTLYSFAIFAVAFIARPLGTVIFMAVDRQYGKSAKLTSRHAAARHRYGRDRLPARLLRDRRGVDLAAGAGARRPGSGLGRRLGRSGVAAGAQRARRSSAAGTR